MPEHHGALREGLKEFLAFLRDFRSLGSWMVKVLPFAPLSDLAIGLGPPWPSQTSTPVLASLVGALSLVFGFAFWSARPQYRLKSYLRRSGLALGVFFVLYGALFAYFIYDAPSPSNREIKGLYYLTEVKAVIDNSYTESMALRGASYDPFKIWVAWTVYAMRLVVLVSWLATSGALYLTIGVFVMLLRSAHRSR
jgi:hypothetical protein